LIDDASSSDEAFVKATRAKRAEFFKGVAPENQLAYAWNELEPGYFSPREMAALAAPEDRLALFLKRPCANDKHHQCQHCGARQIVDYHQNNFYCENDDCDYEYEVDTYHWADADESCQEYYYWTSP
jgi:hypothetical protein